MDVRTFRAIVRAQGLGPDAQRPLAQYLSGISPSQRVRAEPLLRQAIAVLKAQGCSPVPWARLGESALVALEAALPEGDRWPCLAAVRAVCRLARLLEEAAAQELGSIASPGAAVDPHEVDSSAAQSQPAASPRPSPRASARAPRWKVGLRGGKPFALAARPMQRAAARVLLPPSLPPAHQRILEAHMRELEEGEVTERRRLLDDLAGALSGGRRNAASFNWMRLGRGALTALRDALDGSFERREAKRRAEVLFGLLRTAHKLELMSFATLERNRRALRL